MSVSGGVAPIAANRSNRPAVQCRDHGATFARLTLIFWSSHGECPWLVS
jgi:hypothetical protein